MESLGEDPMSLDVGVGVVDADPQIRVDAIFVVAERLRHAEARRPRRLGDTLVDLVRRMSAIELAQVRVQEDVTADPALAREPREPIKLLEEVRPSLGVLEVVESQLPIQSPEWREALHDPDGNLGQSQRAIRDYDEAIRLNPQLALAYMDRGSAYGHLGQSQRAIQDGDPS